MKNFFAVLLLLLLIIGCKSKKNLTDTDTLPKDVALKPERVADSLKVDADFLEKERKNLRIIQAAINELIQSKTCSNTEDWRISPLGSKPCGGPASYIAYHKEVEEEILPKIQEFTRRQAFYNQKAGVFSDCMIEPQPSGLQCENGKPKLLYNSGTVSSQ